MIKKEENSPLQINDNLKRLAAILLLNARFTERPGLGKGKLGIAIFMYHYARYTGSKQFTDCAGSLIDDLYDGINTSTPVDFENGLTGIAWGISYLISNGFIGGDTDEILGDIDIAINEKLNEFPPEERSRIADESGYYLYRESKMKKKAGNCRELFSFIKPGSFIKEPFNIPVLINPDNYGLFEGMAGEAFLMLDDLKTERIRQTHLDVI